MKKIITLVLALVMVFAVAASASALVPENALTTVNASDRFDLKVELTGGPVVAGTTITIPTVVANKAYVQNEVLFYAITVVAKKGYNPATQTESATMTIAGTGVNVAGYATQLKAYEYTMGVATPWSAYTFTTDLTTAGNAVYNTITIGKGDVNAFVAKAYGPAKYDSTYVISGYGLVTSATTAPAITVKIAATMAKGVTYKTAAGYTITKTEAIAESDAVNAWMVTDATANSLTFKTNATGKCVYIGLTMKDAATKQIVKGDYVNALGSWVNGWLDVAGNTLTAAEQAVADKIMTFMGFDYALRDTNAILDTDFMKKTTETNLVATANGNIFADKVTTDTVTVVPEVSAPVIEVPKTGSAATFAGIALIVLAAAAAFVSKKVRA